MKSDPGRIVLLGAGLGGLTCAIALRKAGFDVRIFERDPEPDAREQGFVVNLESGLAALDTLGLGDAVRTAGFPTPGLNLLDHRGRFLIGFPSRGAFSVGRPVLRRMLLDAVPPDAIVWNARCAGYEEDAAGAAVLFEEGRREEAGLVVACDGVRSAVRQEMHGDPLVYLGVSIVGGEVSGEAGEVASHADLLRAGKVMILNTRGSCYLTQYSGENKIRWSIGLKVEQGSLEEAFPDKEDLRKEVLRRVEDWHPLASAVVAATPVAQMRVRPVFDRDPLPPWKSGRVTLLGDAAHPMSPYRGLGANLAMEDAVDLARELASPSHPDVSAALSAYESTMLRRGAAAQTASRRLAQVLHLENPLACALRNAAMRTGNLLSRAAGRLPGESVKS